MLASATNKKQRVPNRPQHTMRGAGATKCGRSADAQTQGCQRRAAHLRREPGGRLPEALVFLPLGCASGATTASLRRRTPSRRTGAVRRMTGSPGWRPSAEKAAAQNERCGRESGGWRAASLAVRRGGEPRGRRPATGRLALGRRMC